MQPYGGRRVVMGYVPLRSYQPITTFFAAGYASRT